MYVSYSGYPNEWPQQKNLKLTLRYSDEGGISNLSEPTSTTRFFYRLKEWKLQYDSSIFVNANNST